MDKHLLDWACTFLDVLTDIQGNAGCNDCEWPDGWTDDQKRAFILGRYRLNSGTTLKGGPEFDYLTDDLTSLRCPPDFVCVGVLADILRREATPGR